MFIEHLLVDETPFNALLLLSSRFPMKEFSS